MPLIQQSLEIAAPIAEVYKIARDVEAFPDFMKDLQSLRIVEQSPDSSRTVTEWVGLIPEFRMSIKWTQEDVWDDTEHTDTFRLIKGDLDKMSGTWRFTEFGSGSTRFESTVDYEYEVPLIGPMVKNLIKKKMSENLQATMEAIRVRAEAAAGKSTA